MAALSLTLNAPDFLRVISSMHMSLSLYLSVQLLFVKYHIWVFVLLGFFNSYPFCGFIDVFARCILGMLTL